MTHDYAEHNTTESVTDGDIYDDNMNYDHGNDYNGYWACSNVQNNYNDDDLTMRIKSMTKGKITKKIKPQLTLMMMTRKGEPL